MTTGSRWLVSAVVWVGVAGVVIAQTPALDVKMGLWEVTSVTDIGGRMPAIDTSKMTPEQKAQMEAAMKATMGAHSNVTRTCMTREKFDKSNFLTRDESGMCKQTITTNTSTTLDASVTCSGERSMTGQMHIEALSSTSIKANMRTSATMRGGTMTANLAMTGKWLDADCGNTK